jgi:hypothetical protein
VRIQPEVAEDFLDDQPLQERRDDLMLAAAAVRDSAACRPIALTGAYLWVPGSGGLPSGGCNLVTDRKCMAMWDGRKLPVATVS